MARGRMISKTLSTSVCFARLFDVSPAIAEFAQSLYPLLVSHADDFGREQGDTMTVKYRIHPRSPRSEGEFAEAMTALRDVGLIEWYEVRGRRCYQISKFDDHQSGLHKRTRSQFPAFPGTSGNFPESPGQLKGREENGREGKRTELNGTQQERLRRAAPASPAVLEFPTTGKPQTWALTEADIAEWEALYPSLSILAEARQALAWVKANPSKKKTASGMPRFLVSWFTRSVNSGRTAPTDKTAAARKRALGPVYRGHDCPHDPQCNSPEWCAAQIARDELAVKS